VVNVPNFLTFAGDANLRFTLTELDLGTFSSAACSAAPAAGQTCTPNVPGGSPFNLINISTGTAVASFNVEGMMQDTAIVGSVPTLYHGHFFAVLGTNYQTALAALAVPGGTVTATGGASANFNQLPEPASVQLMFAPLLLLGGVLARRTLAARRRA